MSLLSGTLRSILRPDRLMLARRLDEHRSLTVAMCLMCAFTAAGLWCWDRVVDPAGAGRTVGWRLAFLALYVLYALVVQRGRNRLVVISLGLAQVLAGEAVFLVILDRLRTGMVFGIGGFMYFFLVPLVLFQGFSLGVNLLYTVLAAALPHALALAGLAPGFEHARYAVLIWPAAMVTAVAQAAFSRNYRLRYESERELEEASNTDPLTGASNRRHFLPVLAQEMHRCRRFGRPLSLLMLDIDRFKRVNDAYGHPTGDLVIRRVAETCRVLSRDSDVLARLGGEEFAVLLPEAGLPGALAYAERIREDVEALAIPGPGRATVRCTVSIGVAEFRHDDLSGEDLVGRADGALYRAKGAGRNQVCA